MGKLAVGESQFIEGHQNHIGSNHFFRNQFFLLRLFKGSVDGKRKGVKRIVKNLFVCKTDQIFFIFGKANFMNSLLFTFSVFTCLKVEAERA